MNPVESEIARLAPIIGSSKAERLWLLYQTEPDLERKREVEAAIRSLAFRHLGQSYTKDRILLPPGPTRSGDIHVGTVHYGGKEAAGFFLERDDLLRHCGIFGMTGSGKTNLALHLIRQFLKKGMPFMVFDWKRSYRDLMATDFGKGLTTFTVGRTPAPFSFNPFHPPPGTDQQTWDAKVIDVFCHSHFLGHGVRYWLMNLLLGMEGRSLDDLLAAIQKTKSIGRRREWLDSALRAVGDLCQGPNAGVFAAPNATAIESMLSKPVVFELDGLSNDGKTFFVETILAWLHQHGLNRPERQILRHIVVIEESHHVLQRRPAYMEEQGVTDIVFREIRELSEGIIYLDQHPSMISKPALGNAGTTVVMKLQHQDDVRTANDVLMLDQGQRDFPGLLDPGWAIVRAPSSKRPFLIRIPEISIKKGFVTDEMLKRWNQGDSRGGDEIPPHSPRIPEIPPPPQEEKNAKSDRETLAAGEIRFLKDVLEHRSDGVVNRYERLGLSARQGTKLKNELEAKGLVTQARISIGEGTVNLLGLTQKGLTALDIRNQARPPAGRSGGPEHRYWIDSVSEELRAEGFSVEKEARIGHGKTVDLAARKNGSSVAIEIETGKSDIEANIRKNAEAGFDKVFVLTTSRKDRDRLRKIIEDDGKAHGSA